MTSSHLAARPLSGRTVMRPSSRPSLTAVAMLASFAVLGLTACERPAERQLADSTAGVQSAKRLALMTQLAAQKDSLTRIVLQADDFIMRIDKRVSSAKGMPKSKASSRQLDPLARQIENRKLVMARVDALVARANATAAQLSKENRSNTALHAQIASDSALITDLKATIERQTAMIDALSVRVDSLKQASQQLASSLAAVETEQHKAYVVIGREDELVKRGVIVREGGANLLFARPGRTLQIARSVPVDAFTTVDQRGVKVISMPDSTRRYRIISRQSLDNAVVDERKQNSFRGNLTIADAGRFWAPSKYLVLVEQ